MSGGVVPAPREGADRLRLCVLAAGRGQRMTAGRRPAVPAVPKALLPVGSGTVLDRLLAQFGPWHTSTEPALVVVRRGEAAVREHVAAAGLRVQTVEQTAGPGMVGALRTARELLGETALVVLGDLVFQGGWDGVPTAAQAAVGVWPAGPGDAVRCNYGVTVVDGRVRSLVEKPAHAHRLTCGVGVYVLPPELLARVVHEEDGPGLTECLDAAAGRIPIRPLGFRGWYVNLNTPADLAAARLRLGGGAGRAPAGGHRPAGGAAARRPRGAAGPPAGPIAVSPDRPR